MNVPQDCLFIADRRLMFHKPLQKHPAAYRVFIALMSWGNNNNECWPSYEQLSERSAVARRHIPRALAVCKSLGILDWTTGGQRNGVNVPNKYRIVTLAHMAGGTPQSHHRGPQKVRKGDPTASPVSGKGINKKPVAHAEQNNSPEGEPLRDTNRIRAILEAELGRPA